MKPIFEKRVIGTLDSSLLGGPMNTLGATGDINGDGRMDFVTCGRNGRMIWLENLGNERWKEHFIAHVKNQECGGCLIDLTGNGRADVINGSDGMGYSMNWWENTGEPGPWKQRMIAETANTQFHDTDIGHIKNDGVPYLVFDNQANGTDLYCVPLPKDPRVSPWPGLELIDSGLRLPNPHRPDGHQPDEGIAIGDVDNDGQLEIVCGVHWFKWVKDHWEKYLFTDENFITNKIVIADINGDGRNEILVSEGDAWIYGKKEGGKLACFTSAGDAKTLWAMRLLDTGLLDAHTLRLGNLCGNGRPDILVGEIGAKAGNSEAYAVRLPRIYVYENDGQGGFDTRYTIDEGTGIHEGILLDLTGDGRLDLIGKPLHGPEQWNIHVFYNRTPAG